MKMKMKIIISLLSGFLFVGFLTPQAAAQSTRKAGIKGGLNVSNLYVDDVTDENPRYGFNIGVFGEVLSSDVVALQLELLYSTKGSHDYYDGVFGDGDVKYNLNYLDLPVLAVIKLGPTAEIHLGGYASYLLGANIEYSGFVNGSDEVDKDRLNSFDYGLTGGVGFNFGAIQLGARYNYGLAKIADDDVADFLIGDAKNSNAQVYLAFNFMHNK